MSTATARRRAKPKVEVLDTEREITVRQLNYTTDRCRVELTQVEDPEEAYLTLFLQTPAGVMHEFDTLSALPLADIEQLARGLLEAITEYRRLGLDRSRQGIRKVVK